MTDHTTSFRLTSLALATAAMISACGGGDASPPAETVAPTMNLVSNVAGVAVGPVSFTFTLSEDVGTSFTADDVAVSNGSKGAFTKISPTQYTLAVTPAANSSGTLAVSVAAGSFEDLVGNKVVAANALSQAFDTRPPALTITSSAAGTTASTDVTFSFSFSKDVGTSFSADDITVTGGSKGSFTRSSGTSATLVVSVAANNAGTINVSVPVAAVADAGGTSNTAPATLAQAFNTVIAVVATKLVTFDEATPPKLTGFGGAEDASVVADQTNAANKVAKIVKSATAELWAGATLSICPSDAIVKVPFAAGSTTLSARVWSPDAGIPVRLKLEDAADPTKSVETEATTTAGGVWQTLNFNFAVQAAGTAALNLATTYNKASIFFNFGKTGAQAGGAKTYYLDDLSFVGSTFAVACPSTGPAQPTISFDEATAPKLTGFGGAEDAAVVADPQNAANKVARVIKSATAELWAGTTFSTLSADAVPTIAFSATNKTITVRVLSPLANVPVRLKVENASDPTKSVETEATVTSAGAWQVLTFNFANQAAGTAALNLATTYNKASIFFNFGKTGAESGGARTYHFDEVKFPVAVADPGGATATKLTFDEATAPKLTGFGGAEDTAVGADPQNAANKVARVIKSATAELWAGTTVSTLAGDALPAVGFSASNTTITVRVLSPVANIPVRLKVESATDGSKSVETEATVTAANTWQTLTFNFANQAAGTAALNLATTYNKASIFFNFGKTGAESGGARTYYFEDLSYTTATTGGGGGTGTLAGGIFAAEYTGNLGVVGSPKSTLGGDIGFFYDARLANTKAYDFGGISGPAQNPGGVNNFYFGFGLNRPAITDAFFGAYVNAPGNGRVDVSGYSNILLKFWGPAETFERSFTPQVQIVLAGPTVPGCASNSGRSEIQRTVAGQKIGAGADYLLPLSSFTIKFACSGETSVAQVLAKLAQVNYSLINSNIQYSVPDPGATPAYPTGLNIGPIKFN